MSKLFEQIRDGVRSAKFVIWSVKQGAIQPAKEGQPDDEDYQPFWEIGSDLFASIGYRDALLEKISASLKEDVDWEIRIESDSSERTFVSMAKTIGRLFLDGTHQSPTTTSLSGIIPILMAETQKAGIEALIEYKRPQVGRLSYEWALPCDPEEICEVAWTVWTEVSEEDPGRLVRWTDA